VVSVVAGTGSVLCMKRFRTATLVAAISTMSITACASDDPPDDTVPTDTVPADGDVPFDPEVGDGIDTEVEQSGNLEFDEPDEG